MVISVAEMSALFPVFAELKSLLLMHENLSPDNAEFPKPVILESPKSANGYKGENMTLSCIAAISGESQPKIYWKKDNMVRCFDVSYIPQ